MEKLKVAFVAASATPAAIPVEVATHFDPERIDLTIIPYYGDAASFPGYTGAVVPLYARGPLDFAAWRALYRLLRNLRPDVIHVNHTVPAFVGSLIGRLLRVPLIVVTEHHDHHDISLKLAPVNLATFSLVNAIICNSNYTRSSFRWWERPSCRRKCLTIYNGVDLAAIDASFYPTDSRYSHLDSSRLVIGTVGRLVREKDQKTLIRAIAIARQLNSNIHLVIVGDGPLRSELESLAQELGLCPSITFTGELERADVYALLSTFDIFVMSSITEGFCNAVVEAMAAHRPVIATQAGALPEVIGSTGWFVPPGHAEAIASMIHEILALPQNEIDARTRAARQRVEDCFTVERTARAYETHYFQKLAGRRAALA